MNKLIALSAAVFFFSSCSDKKTEPTTTTTEPTVESKTAAEVKPLPAFLDAVKYKNWEIGDPETMKPVIEFYKLWDKKEAQSIAGLFGDTISLRIPEEKEEIVVPNNKVQELLIPNMGMYTTTLNNVISAVSLHNRDSNENWVFTIVYSKWTESSGKKDSVVFSDKWRIKDGKIVTLLSFDKKVSTYLSGRK